MKTGLWVLGCLAGMVALSGCCPGPYCENPCEKISQERLMRIQDLEAAQERQLLRADNLQKELDAMANNYDACQKKLGLLDSALPTGWGTFRVCPNRSVRWHCLLN